MKYWSLIITAALLPTVGFAQKKEIVELQRDIALLQDQVRTLQRSQDEKMAALMVLVQQALEAANKANTSVAVLQSGINERIGDQTKTVGGTVAAIGNKVDTMSDEFRGVRDSISDLNSRMGKLDAKLTDISNAVRTMAASQPAGGAAPGGPTPGGPPPGQAPSAQTTYENAYRDYQGGRNDLAMQQFQEYLKWFKQTDLAPNAQFYIGDIYLRQGDTDNAIKAFDAVLEQYSENNKTPDAYFMKAKALFQAGQKTSAAQEYCEVVKRYGTSDLAGKARSALRGMGYNPSCGVTAGAAAPAGSSKKKRR